ncbi:RDD family protein [Mucisphaera calidilacus]|uniref:RDD family protein n=1 Tax=Mucisphaera calidilacus TaxID=2527982 RepID=A0A518BUQ7_9BACT|nr:RDD family protein [Mucisphaera calidilacus]
MAALSLLVLPGLVLATELRLAGSLEHAWVVARLQAEDPWQVYHLPATGRLERPLRAGEIPAGVEIDGIAAQGERLWVFSGRTVRLRSAVWHELSERWRYREDVGMTLPGEVVSAGASDRSVWVLCRREARELGGERVRSGGVGRSALAVTLGIPADALGEAEAEEAEDLAEATEPVAEEAGGYVLARWAGDSWDVMPVSAAGRVLSLVADRPGGLPWVAVMESEVAGDARVMGVAPLRQEEGVWVLGPVTDLNGVLPAYGLPVVRRGVASLLTASRERGVRLRTEGRDTVLVLNLGQEAGPLQSAITATGFDGGLLVAGVDRWEAGWPRLDWAWLASADDAPRAGTLEVAAIPPPWSQPAYAIPVVIWITSFLLVIMTLEARRRPLRFRPRPVVVAPLGARMTAAMIDFFPCLFVVMWLTDTTFEQMVAMWPGQPLASTWGQVFPGLLTIALFVGSTGLGEALSGRTVGKRLMGLEVRSIDGRMPTATQVVARGLLKAFDVIATLLLLLMIFSRYRQRLGDMVSRTVVVVRGARPELPPRGDGSEERRDG